MLSVILLAWTMSAASQVPPLPTGKVLDFSILAGEWSVEAAPERVDPRFQGSLLTVDSVRSQSRPDGTLAAMENTRVIIRYRRAR